MCSNVRGSLQKSSDDNDDKTNGNAFSVSWSFSNKRGSNGSWETSDYLKLKRTLSVRCR